MTSQIPADELCEPALTFLALLDADRRADHQATSLILNNAQRLDRTALFGAHLLAGLLNDVDEADQWIDGIRCKLIATMAARP